VARHPRARAPHRSPGAAAGGRAGGVRAPRGARAGGTRRAGAAPTRGPAGGRDGAVRVLVFVCIDYARRTERSQTARTKDVTPRDGAAGLYATSGEQGGRRVATRIWQPTFTPSPASPNIFTHRRTGRPCPVFPPRIRHAIEVVAAGGGVRLQSGAAGRRRLRRPGHRREIGQGARVQGR